MKVFTKAEKKKFNDRKQRIQNDLEVIISDLALAEWELRVIKRHFKITPKQWTEIITTVQDKNKNKEDWIHGL